MEGCDNTDRLLYQYAASVRLLALLRALTAENCLIRSELAKLETRLDIDASVGQQLDEIGIIVGVPRPLNIQIDQDEAFGFDEIAVAGSGFPSGVPPDFGWSGASREDRGGRFVGVNGLLVGKMLDSDFRTLIRARIAANSAAGTVEDLLEFLRFVLGHAGSTLVIQADNQISITLGRWASASEIDIITALLPLAAGIGLDEINQPA